MVRAKLLCSIALLFTAFTACAIDAPDDPEALSSSSTAISDKAIATSHDLVNCSVVTTCNAPGNDGTRCRQQPGCSVATARLECALESISTCGVAVCPVILIKLNGTRENLCDQGDRE